MKKKPDLPLFKHDVCYLSSRCTFIYPSLKILKLLATNYKSGSRNIQKSQISESELISEVSNLLLAEYKYTANEKNIYFYTTSYFKLVEFQKITIMVHIK